MSLEKFLNPGFDLDELSNVAVMPRDIMRNVDLSDKAIRILMYMWAFPIGYKFHKYPIARVFNIGSITVKKHLKDLTKKGFINCEKVPVNKNQTITAYTIKLETGE